MRDSKYDDILTLWTLLGRVNAHQVLFHIALISEKFVTDWTLYTLLRVHVCQVPFHVALVREGFGTDGAQVGLAFVVVHVKL